MVVEERKKKPDAEIRQMEIDDISSVYHLGEELFTSEEFPILYRTWDAFEVTDYFSSDPDYCLVAESDGRVVGFTIGTIFEKERTAWKKYGYVSWIGVTEEFQRTGLAQRMYRKLEEKFLRDGVRMVILDTEAGNKNAISFFKTLGFSLSAKHVWMGKTIKQSSRADKNAAVSKEKAVPKPPKEEGKTGRKGKNARQSRRISRRPAR